MPDRFKVSKSDDKNSYKYEPSSGSDGVNQKLLGNTCNVTLKKHNVTGLYRIIFKVFVSYD